MENSKYHTLVDDMGGGVGWRDLREPDESFHRHSHSDLEITGIECLVVEGNFPWNIIKVETSEEEFGIGEAFPGPAVEFIEFLEPGLVGENPMDIDRLVEHMTQLVSGLGGTQGYAQAAVSGIEIALWDVVGKIVDLPVYQLLGGKYRDSVPIYVDCHAGGALENMSKADPREIYSPRSYAEVAGNVLDEGFSALKFDLDVRVENTDTATRRLSNAAIQHKIDIVEAVCEEIDDNHQIGFDLHWNFTVETAQKIAKELEEYDITWLEDPVPPESAETQAKVTKSTTTPILTGENIVRFEGFVPYLTKQAIDIVAPDIQKCGGLLEFRKIAALADSFSIPLAPHNISSPIGTIASGHACSTVPNVFALEWHAREVSWWSDLLETEEPIIRNGAIDVPEKPGLGITLNEDVLEDHLAPNQEMSSF